MKGSARKRLINLLTIGKYKDAVKDVRKAVAAKSKSDATKSLSFAFRELDKAAKKHVIHKNKAARLKSRLSAAVSKIA